MVWVFFSLYLLLHFSAYALVLRHRPFFRTERGIFMFHLLSAIGLVALAAVAFLANQTEASFALVIAVAAAHGIYSLIFLECWALSEGGYSLRILSELVRRGSATPLELEERFVELSERKKEGRLKALVGLGLVRLDGEQYGLTGLGTPLANAMSLIATIARPRERSGR